MTVPLPERLRLLARHLDALERPGFSFGAWEPSHTDRDGAIHLNVYRFSPEAEAFLADVRAGGWVTPFDWPAWLQSPEGSALRDPEGVARAEPEDLARLLTAILRSERFTDGSIAGAYESGLLTAIVRRARELIEDGPPGR
ncbi:MAG TPA: DUF6508 domain-containing protein [Candidatus Limnocylindria bacterium]